jgi:hypothetical protein
MFPLRGLWNTKPAEGDRFAAAEIDWGSYPPGQGVQFQLSGNSPVALSQIVALTVDNARCGSDVQFVFADSGFILQVPAHAGGVYPVFTNGLSFYVIALGAGASDVTCVNVHNSLPPPIPLQLSERQNTAAITGINIANGSTPIVPAPKSGTLNAASIVIDYVIPAGGGGLQMALQDGAGALLWTSTFHAPVSTSGVQHFEISGLAVRFINGLNLIVINSTIVSNDIIVNAYYTVP